MSGTKKWITNGVSAHYFVTAVRTGGAGAMGVSLLLIERDENVTTRLMKTRYGASAGTAFVTFDKVTTTARESPSRNETNKQT